MTDQEIAEANRRHDQEHGNPFDYNLTKVSPGWKEARVLVRGALTDRQIEKYAEMGYFTEEFKELRRKLQAKKRGQRSREGNFDIVEGRLVYRP